MSFLSRLLGTGSDPREAMRPLWHRSVELARDPHWFASCGVADTVEGRFDMITAVMALLLMRMENDPELVRKSVLLTEIFVEDMDGQMRQAGVGDVVVGKHMGRVMGSMGGRLGAYREAFAEPGDEALAQAVERNMSMTEAGDPACVARGLRSLAGRLAATNDADLVAGRIVDGDLRQ